MVGANIGDVRIAIDEAALPANHDHLRGADFGSKKRREERVRIE
jgi:hypothetical protein